MICELCGHDAPYLKPLLVEGSILKVCSNCAKFGKSVPGSTGGEDKKVITGPGSGSGTRTRRDTGRGHSEGSYGFSMGAPTKEEVIKSRLEQRERRQKIKDIYDQSGDKDLAIDYHKRIQQARQDQGWSQEDLGQKINERKSVISKIENKSMKPDDKMIRKLEKALGIKLMEVIE